MKLKRFFKKVAERITNTHILRRLPRGVDLFFDIRHSLPKYRAEVVIDVGANIGEYVREFREHFPQSRIYCIEPVSEIFESLKRNVSRLGNIHCYHIALGKSNAHGVLLIDPRNTMSRLEPTTPDYCRSCCAVTEEVAIKTIVSFSEENGLESIDYLKVDTEGNDLAVLEGAKDMLNAQRIGIVQVEAGMNRENRYHVPFRDLQSHLEDQGYFLFGLYEQCNEWPTGAPHLRRCNCLFISRELASVNIQVA